MSLPEGVEPPVVLRRGDVAVFHSADQPDQELLDAIVEFFAPYGVRPIFLAGDITLDAVHRCET